MRTVTVQYQVVALRKEAILGERTLSCGQDVSRDRNCPYETATNLIEY